MAGHDFFMRMALGEAEKALSAGEFPVGCVFVHQGEIVGRGQRRQSLAASANELDHAEVAALRYLVAEYPRLDREELIVYSTMEPCLMCYSTLLLNGIRRIVYGYEDVMGGGTNLPLADLNPLYREMTVDIVPHILRRECLALFVEFFSNAAHDYWRNSLLAEYTLAQSVK